jgi:predicted metal-dependent phosphoesterase TrpH
LAKADLHVHSKHSNEPAEWYLRQLGAPESFTEPLEIYRRCRARGMDFVTISDHDSIAGALEIQHLPGTFLSCEVTAEFPEDGCEVHVLVSGISEAQHRDLQALRRNLYELRDFIRSQGIIASVAHPLFRVNDKLTLDQVEKLLVLFDRFEALNGMHDRRANGLVRTLFSALTPDAVLDLAARHRLEPFGPAPWKKTFTGGSDDHGGLYLGTTWTETPETATVDGFLSHLRAGDHDAGGATGSSARLVQSLYAISHEFYRRQFPGFDRRKDPFAELLRSLAQVPARERRFFSFGPFRRRPEAAAPVESLTLGSASRASRRHFARLLRGVVLNARRGRIMEGLGAVAQLAPLALSVAPYLVAVHQLHKDSDLLDAAAARFLGRRPEGEGMGRRAWFTDSLHEADGLARVLRSLPGPGRGLTALTCARSEAPGSLAVENFRPWMEIPLPGRHKLALPPLLEVLDHCERERYAEIVISTPGPFGLLGVAVGRLLGIPVTGLWHTDLPFAARRLAGGAAVEELAWAYLRWLFGQAERIFVPSTHDWELLAERGFAPAKLEMVRRSPAGRLDTDEHGPTRTGTDDATHPSPSVPVPARPCSSVLVPVESLP